MLIFQQIYGWRIRIKIGKKSSSFHKVRKLQKEVDKVEDELRLMINNEIKLYIKKVGTL